MSQAHHPLSTGIVTVLSHHATGECWSTEDQAAGNKEDGAQEKAGDQLGSDCFIRSVVAKKMKRTKRTKRKKRVNWKLELWKGEGEYCGQMLWGR